MKRYRADLHVHTCLSPCADLDMSPRCVVEKCVENRVDVVAVCDHNSAENAGATIRAGARRGLCVLPGMEICSREEVHILGIFDREEQALAMQDTVFRHLRGTNRPEIFGDQVVANEFDEVEGFDDRRLIGATDLGLYDIVNQVHRLGGLAIAAHVDRPSYSILSQLGFIPPDLELEALEISPRLKTDADRTALQVPGALPVVTSSDAHFLEDIGKAVTVFCCGAPSATEIRLALQHQEGRKAVAQ
jgi:3',5'-nucleoside bisphosphate phosphatase